MHFVDKHDLWCMVRMFMSNHANLHNLHLSFVLYLLLNYFIYFLSRERICGTYVSGVDPGFSDKGLNHSDRKSGGAAPGKL